MLSFQGIKDAYARSRRWFHLSHFSSGLSHQLLLKAVTTCSSYLLKTGCNIYRYATLHGSRDGAPALEEMYENSKQLTLAQVCKHSFNGIFMFLHTDYPNTSWATLKQLIRIPVSTYPRCVLSEHAEGLVLQHSGGSAPATRSVRESDCIEI